MNNNKKNILWFTASSMKNLYVKMESWQKENKKRFLSFNIEKEDSNYACIALTNPSEVTIVNESPISVEVDNKVDVDVMGWYVTGSIDVSVD